MEKKEKNIKKTSSVLFILGNGFDLNLKMNTRYKDVYAGYVKEESTSETVKKFKEDLKKSEKCCYEKWSDFEIGMAEYAKGLNNENELIECVRDFKRYMVSHLKKEGSEFKKRTKIIDRYTSLASAMYNSLTDFQKAFIPSVKNKIDRMLNIEDVDRDINFITFNYTDTLEELLNKCLRGNRVIHIHGSLNGNIVLGVDNLEQLKTKYSISKRGKRAFVKTLINNEYDPDVVEEAKELIAKSDVICIFGFSLGETDKTWVDLIANWLLTDSSHHLAVFNGKNDSFDQCNSDEIMDVEDEKKEVLKGILKINDEVAYNQIHIAIEKTIFDFDRYLGKIDDGEAFGIPIGSVVT